MVVPERPADVADMVHGEISYFGEANDRGCSPIWTMVGFYFGYPPPKRFLGSRPWAREPLAATSLSAGGCLQ